MRNPIGYYSPETARTIKEVVDYLLRNGFVMPAGRRNQQTIEPTTPIYVRNDSGEEVPPFACMQTTDPGTVESGPQNYITIGKPADTTGDGGIFLFNGEHAIPASGDGTNYGIGHPGPIARMLTDGSAVNHADQWGPVVDQWEIAPGGSLFFAIGEDDIAPSVIKGAFLASGGGGGSAIGFTIDSIRTAGDTGDDAPYNGLEIATVTVVTAPCDRSSLIGTTVDVVDHSGCIFDVAVSELEINFGWAEEQIAESRASSASPGDLTPCHWAAINRCC